MSKDIIYREDAIKVFMLNSKGERIPFVDCDNFPVEFPLRYIVDTLAALPSADRPQGEWVFVEEFMGINRYKCSACEREELRTHLSNFCPNCGARMRPKLQGTHFDSIIIDECAVKGDRNE